MDVECKKLEKEIAANIFDKILLSNEETTGFDFIYDLEGLSSLSLFRELEFKRSDIKELVLSYLAADEIKKQNLSFNAYLLPAMHLKGMCKAYNKVKEMYFQNNKETMYVEVSALKKDLLRARSDLKMQENRNEQLLNIQNEKVESLLSENVQLEKQIKKLQEQINQIQAESKEIVALRNYIFKQEEIEQTDENVDINTIKLDKINEVKGMIVGGHINWQNKLREMIPSWRIIKAGVNTLDENIILNSNIVVFNTAHLNHSLYYRIIDVIRNTDVKIGYISSTNIENALKEILELLV